MKHATLVLAVLLVSACDAMTVSADPFDVDIQVEARGADGEVPAHVALIAPRGDQDPATVNVALLQKAQETCGEGQLGDILESPFGEEADPAVMRFTCKDAPLPGRADLAADAGLPDQPGLAPGQQRDYSWGSAMGLGERKPFESMLGGRMRALYVEECREAGLLVDRIATYVQPDPDETGLLRDGVKTHLVIDYRCTAGDDTAAAAAQ